MESISAEKAFDKIQSYFRIESDDNLPYFVFVDSPEDYKAILDKLCCERIAASDFCASSNVWPDYGRLSDVAQEVTGRTVLVGLGDVAMLGAPDPLPYVRDLALPQGGKLVVLCRGARKLLSDTKRVDGKFDSRRFCLVGDLNTDCRIVKVDSGAPFQALKTEKKYDSLQAALKALEEGASGKLYVSTDLDVRADYQISSVRDALCETEPQYRKIPEDAIDATLWEKLANGALNDDEEYDDLDWRSYVNLLLNPSDNSYLQLVMKYSDNYQKYQRSFFDAILEIDGYGEGYEKLYGLRKKLLVKLDKETLEEWSDEYVNLANAKYKGNAAPYLTDLTSVERRRIIELVVQTHKTPNLALIYPKLADYLEPFNFSGSPNAKELTQYFDEYRRCKLNNQYSQEALDLVQKYARPDESNQIFLHTFPSRANILGKLDDGTRYLYWLDALGLEYLGFIQKLANQQCLHIEVKIGCCKLPSTTEVNREFYDKWQAPSEQTTAGNPVKNKKQNKSLDKLIHKQDPDYSSDGRNETPFYLEKALEVITTVVKEIKKLLRNNASSVVLVSDHGATRGPSIAYNTGKSWPCKEDGEEGGRVVKASDGDELPDCAIEGENGYWSLANYDRFKGGNLQGYEAHGGATLEEALVPIIEFTLSDGEVDIKILTKEVKKGRHNAPAILELDASKPLKSLTLETNGRQFHGEKVSDRRFKFELVDMRAGKHEFECKEGENHIGDISVEIKGSGGNLDRSFVDDFNDN